MLGSTQEGPTWGRGRSKGTDLSDALPALTLTLSDGEATFLTSPAEATWWDEEEEEEEEDEEDDEQEGGSGGDLEEEVGREWVDMTNL